MQRTLVITVFLLIIVLISLSLYLNSSKDTSNPNFKFVFKDDAVVDKKIIKDITFNKDVYKTIIKNPKDTIGRTLIYERNDGKWLSGTGIKQSSNTSLKFVIGSVQQITSIADSPDLYITLVDPLNNSFLVKTRIVLEKEIYATDFRSENVSKLQESEPVISKLGISYDVGKEKILELLQLGDTITVQFTPNDPNDYSILKVDENKQPFAARVIVRRFSDK